MVQKSSADGGRKTGARRKSRGGRFHKQNRRRRAVEHSRHNAAVLCRLSRGQPVSESKEQTMENDRHQQQSKSKRSDGSRPDGQQNASQRHAKACGKNAKKHNNRSGKKSAPPPRIVCAVEERLVSCIQEKRSQDVGRDDLLDIPKEEINALPDVPYQQTKNAVVLVTNAAASDRAVAAIRTELAMQQRCGGGGSDGDDHVDGVHYLGFDTETRPKFRKGGENHDPALLQLATQTTAYLFRLTYHGMERHASVMTESLRNLLSDATIIKVGVGIHHDASELNRVHGPHNCCGDCTSFLDIGPLATLRWPSLKRVGLRNLTATVLRMRLSKAQQMKNWEMKRLTPAMVAYAAADAFVALDLIAAIMS